jgi:hypothetical protein
MSKGGPKENDPRIRYATPRAKAEIDLEAYRNASSRMGSPPRGEVSTDPLHILGWFFSSTLKCCITCKAPHTNVGTIYTLMGQPNLCHVAEHAQTTPVAN